MKIPSFIFALLLLASPGMAKPRVSSGASGRPIVVAGGECLQTALNGRIEGDCADDPESDSCVGMKMALRNSLRQDQCRARAGQGCLIYGYRQNTQAQWLAVASSFLSEALQCVKAQYGTDESAGFTEALADPAFRLKLIRLEDGGAAFGLREGELLQRVLKGEELSAVLKTSPAWSMIDPRERDRMLAAAEAPVAPPIAINTSAPEAGTGRMGSSPLLETAATRTPRAEASRSPASVASPGASGIMPPESKGQPQPAQKPKISDPSANTYVRNIKRNPFSLGLDLTLFDRVSSVYQKKGEELRGVDDYIKQLPKKQEPRDVRELLSRSKIGDI